jgi:hypothetical protein
MVHAEPEPEDEVGELDPVEERQVEQRVRQAQTAQAIRTHGGK